MKSFLGINKGLSIDPEKTGDIPVVFGNLIIGSKSSIFRLPANAIFNNNLLLGFDERDEPYSLWIIRPKKLLGFFPWFWIKKVG